MPEEVMTPEPEMFTYEILELPPSCGRYKKGGLIQVELIPPAPATITLGLGGECDQITAKLVE